MPDDKLTVITPNQRVPVTITYDSSAGTPTVIVTPSVIELEPGCGCVIDFKRAGNMPGMMRVTFVDRRFINTDNAQFADTGVFHEGDGDVRVDSLDTGQGTTFLCELVVDGQVVARSNDMDGRFGGGAVEPVKQ